jgi:hypothetical protein
MLSVYAEKEEKVTNAEKGERETSLASWASSTSSASSIYCEECYQKEIYS